MGAQPHLQDDRRGHSPEVALIRVRALLGAVGLTGPAQPVRCTAPTPWSASRGALAERGLQDSLPTPSRVGRAARSGEEAAS